MAEIHRLRVNFKGDLPPESVIDFARGRGIEEIIIIGRMADGSVYLDYSRDDPAKVNWLMDRAKFSLVERGG